VPTFKGTRTAQVDRGSRSGTSVDLALVRKVSVRGTTFTVHPILTVDVNGKITHWSVDCSFGGNEKETKVRLKVIIPQQENALHTCSRTHLGRSPMEVHLSSSGS